MPTLAASNRTQLAVKLEGAYPTNWGVPQGGNGTLMNLTSENLDFNTKTETSKQLRSDRAILDIVQVGAQSAGGFGFEAQYRDYDPMIEGIMQAPFTAYGTNGISGAFAGTLTMTSTTVLTSSVASAGADLFTTLEKGQWFSIIPAAGASAAVKAYLKSRAFRLSASVSPTSTVLTLDAATPVDTSILTAPLGAGWKISSSRVSNGNTMNSYTLEVQHNDIQQYRVYTGMIPSKMDLKLSVGAILTGNFEFMGKSFQLKNSGNGGSVMGSPLAAQTYTPANATSGIFDIFENGASISATTYIKSADISIDNSLRIQDAVGVFGAAGVAPGTLICNFKLEVYFADSVIYRKLLDNTASSLTIPVLDVDGNGYIYYFPRVRYTSAKVGTQGQDQDNMLSMEAQAIPDNVVGSPTIGRTVVIYRVGV